MTDLQPQKFENWFKKTTGYEPFPYQRSFAEASVLPQLIDVPTGCGKTAMSILGWLWRRRFHPDGSVRQSSPRRLVYCLPMRVLAEQTMEETRKWLRNLDLLAEPASREDENRVGAHLLMGGEIDNDWDLYPERDAILAGTQDQLLSRALNRGYAMGRYRWPMHFGLLNNDCMWIMDEVQLMGAGLPTTAQLQAFRETLGTYGPTSSIWMSATLKAENISTVDFQINNKTAGSQIFKLMEEDLSHASLKTRLTASKPLQQARTRLDKDSAKTYCADLAAEVSEAHKPQSLTLVVVNQVRRAQEIFKKLEKLCDKRENSPRLLLLHSRFRPGERKQKQTMLMELNESHPAEGAIIVATQAIEAGVDISARVLFAELAPWSSLVQRFGRCNRRGEYAKDTTAQVNWVDIATDDEKFKELPPYSADDLKWARSCLASFQDVGPRPVSNVKDPRPSPVNHVIRRKDIIDLFDTTPDLAGFDTDVSRYIREGDNNDVQVFWRTWEGEKPPAELSGPSREELCAVSISRIRAFLKDRVISAYLWDSLEGEWTLTSATHVWPGITLLLPATVGGYHVTLGWTGDKKDIPPEIPLDKNEDNDSTDKDVGTFAGRWVTLKAHTDDDIKALEEIYDKLQSALPGIPWEELTTAVRYHDAGKAHEVFQGMLLFSLEENDPHRNGGPWAKSGHRNGRPTRKHFRHELASALAMLQKGQSDLAVYLAASHHGKIRLSIRSLPGEQIPPNGTRFARGIWENDSLPETDLGGGVVLPAITLSLGYMEMGLGENGSSWLERMLSLRGDYGPFRLSFLEALVRVADWRGSAQTVTKNE